MESLHKAIHYTNISHLKDDEKNNLISFLNTNPNQASSVVDASENRFKDDKDGFSKFLTQMAHQRQQPQQPSTIHPQQSTSGVSYPQQSQQQAHQQSEQQKYQPQQSQQTFPGDTQKYQPQQHQDQPTQQTTQQITPGNGPQQQRQGYDYGQYQQFRADHDRDAKDDYQSQQRRNQEYDYEQYQQFKSGRGVYGGDSSYQQRPDLRKDQYNDSGEVNIFRNDDDVNSAMTFDPYVDWNAVKSNFNLHSGWLKRKGDKSNKRVRSPFPPGDYTLIDPIPETKRIRVVYSSTFGNYWNSDQRVLIHHNDSQDDIKKKIQSTLKFDRRHFNICQLIESGSHNKINSFDFNDLDENRTYELVIPWLSKIQRRKEDDIASKGEGKESMTSSSSSSSAQKRGCKIA